MNHDHASHQHSSPSFILLSDEDAQPRLDLIRRLVAQPIPNYYHDDDDDVNSQNKTPWTDPYPALIADGSVLIGNKYHAANFQHLKKLGVTAVLNCASGGISRLPVEEMRQAGIEYAFTNVRQDNATYPILHDPRTGECSEHLQVAKQVYGRAVKNQFDGNNSSGSSSSNNSSSSGNGRGKVLFFCVAGQNRSATLAIAVLMLYGKSLEEILESCAKTRPFILENVGFQRQLVELEAMLTSPGSPQSKRIRLSTRKDDIMYLYGTPPVQPMQRRTTSELAYEDHLVEIELLIPGLCTMEVLIPIESTIATVKQCLIDHANKNLLSYRNNNSNNDNSPQQQSPTTISKSWLVLAMFGYDDMYDFPLEVEAIDLNVQLQRMKTMFHLQVTEKKLENGNKETVVRWTEKCRFALVILAVSRKRNDGITIQEPWTFVHEERPGAPATLLKNTPMHSNLRAWDFVTGQAFASEQPIVFSFAKDPRDRRSFMQISTSANEMQQFYAPGEGGILGMGANAIVHRVKLKPTSAEGFNGSGGEDNSENIRSAENVEWDAAVKRPFGLSKMLAFLKHSSEAGVAKRLRFANALNSDGRILYFYGLGVGLSANASSHQEYKWEVMLLARYEKHFSAYTMRRFMEDYVAIPDRVPAERRQAIVQLQTDFSLISVKLLLVNLLNAFRDLTLMGVHAFDFNHLNNVLVSRDSQTVQLIDIDGDSKGSIQFPSEYIEGPPDPASPLNRRKRAGYHKPSLDIDLNTVLPTVVQQLLLGKGRGNAFVTNKKSEIWHAKPEKAKELIRDVLRENFFPDIDSEKMMMQTDEDENLSKTEKHLSKVAEWFYAMLKNQSPWDKWTNDIYDALRCIDHLPIS